MINFIKHMEDFEHDDNLRGKYKKHIPDSFIEDDNFIKENTKHVLKFEKDDNLRGVKDE